MQNKIKKHHPVFKKDRMMRRICIQGKVCPLFSLALSWTVTAKADISRSSGLRGRIVCFLPIAFIKATVESRLPNVRLQRRHRTGFTPVSLFTGPERPTLIPEDILMHRGKTVKKKHSFIDSTIIVDFILIFIYNHTQ